MKTTLAVLGAYAQLVVLLPALAVVTVVAIPIGVGRMAYEKLSGK